LSRLERRARAAIEVAGEFRIRCELCGIETQVRVQSFYNIVFERFLVPTIVKSVFGDTLHCVSRRD
jgi:hypothetical protein